MQKQLLVYALIIALLSSYTLSGQEKNQLTIITDNVECVVGHQYKMLMTDYSDKVYDYLKDHPRIVVDYKPADPSLILNGGTWFKAIKEGETDVTLLIYGEEDGVLGAPDYNNLLDQATFHVVNKSAVELQIPEWYTTWGTKRQEVDKELVDKLHYANITERYTEMTPSLTPELMKPIEVYNNGSFETPFILNYYNDNDELYASALVLINFSRVIPADKSPIRAMLESKGFVQTGTDEADCFEMLNEQTKTQATCEFFSLQGVYVMAVTQMGLDYLPNSVADVIRTEQSLRAYYQGNTLYIDSEQATGELLSIYSIGGSLLFQKPLVRGVQTIEMPTAIPVIVRAGETPAIKVLP
ncbi:hypothetical protein [uncultured Porphyromonas sp.]|uniref:hypothetical protein n=1 Tax=uncultured Porphyromonas sp. TaxID=159274 RepID=UPI0026280F25|nr:hypothetical protein [uncultured Porphyromonas sp.]